ncbi:hypothetical protein BDR07DRAFT_1421948 [Suillus spraguei]|nr:hypothetical protein BDR07DRAFT_1421948 [Suillus spraguei]
MLWLCESLAGMGAEIEEKNFYAMILPSLPKSYRPLLSSINARQPAKSDHHPSKKGANSARLAIQEARVQPPPRLTLRSYA